MSLPLISLIAGLALWAVIGVWAEFRFRKKAEGHDYKRKVVFYNWEKVETDDPFVRRAHRQRTLIVYGSFAVIAITLLIVFPNA